MDEVSENPRDAMTPYPDLPGDYHNWSSTVIFFQEVKSCINVLARDCDTGCTYYVVNIGWDEYIRLGEVAYTAGDSKVFFIGNAEGHEDPAIFSQECKVYDIPKRQWLLGYPRLRAFMPKPVMFFVDMRLYVLSSSMTRRHAHFEMLDINNLSRGWLSLPEPAFVWTCVRVSSHAIIIDYSKKMLYVGESDWGLYTCTRTLYAFSLKDKIWHKYRRSKSLSPCTCNLMKASWSSRCVIVENHLYKFRVYKYTEKFQAMLIIRNLEHNIKVYNKGVQLDYVDYIHSYGDPPIDGTYEVDLSRIVDPNVLLDKHANGKLIYLGKRNSDGRFSLVIRYSVFNDVRDRIGQYVYTCTFDLESTDETFYVKKVGNSTNSCAEEYHRLLEEEKKVGCCSPQLDDYLSESCDKTDLVLDTATSKQVLMTDLHCGICKLLLCRPVVLNCGHGAEAKAADCKSLPKFNLSTWLMGGGSVHYGFGCDCCGMYPIVGERYKCKDCKEKIGFDLCEGGYKNSSKLPGRFNQQHTPQHRFDLVQPRSIFSNALGIGRFCI